MDSRLYPQPPQRPNQQTSALRRGRALYNFFSWEWSVNEHVAVMNATKTKSMGRVPLEQCLLMLDDVVTRFVTTAVPLKQFMYLRTNTLQNSTGNAQVFVVFLRDVFRAPVNSLVC